MEVAEQFLRKLSETWCELSELIRQGKYPGILAIHNGEDSVILLQGVHLIAEGEESCDQFRSDY